MTLSADGISWLCRTKREKAGRFEEGEVTMGKKRVEYKSRHCPLV